MKKFLKNPGAYAAGAALQFPAKAFLDSMEGDEKFANFFLQCISSAVRFGGPGTYTSRELATWPANNPQEPSAGHEHQVWLEFDDSVDFAIQHSTPSQVERLKKSLQAAVDAPETSLGAKHLLHMIDWSLDR